MFLDIFGVLFMLSVSDPGNYSAHMGGRRECVAMPDSNANDVSD